MGTENVKQYSELAWPAATTELRSEILMVPTGAIEQHGPHLPLSVDLDIPTQYRKSCGKGTERHCCAGDSLRWALAATLRGR